MSKYKPIKLQEFQTTAMSLTTIIDIDYRLDTVDIRAYPTDRHDIYHKNFNFCFKIKHWRTPTASLASYQDKLIAYQ